MLELLERTFPLDKPFTLQEVYPVVTEDLQRQYPNSNSIAQTIRSNLQKLRDEGIIMFDDDNPGTYRWSNHWQECWTQDEPVNGTVYILKNTVGGGGYKIGISRVIKNRLKQLEVGTKAEVVGLWESTNYSDLERMLHQRYRSVRVPQSEWFLLDKDQLQDAITWLNENASQKECTITVTPPPSQNKILLYTLSAMSAALWVSFLYLNHRIDMLQLS